MTCSDNRTSWAKLMKMYFNVNLIQGKERDGDATEWFSELRQSESCWKYNPSEGDQFTSERGREINDELCDVLRYIKDLDKVPRKNQGKARDESKGKFTVADVQLWVYLYRKSKGQDGDELMANKKFVEMCCKAIQWLIKRDRNLDAASITVDPVSVDDCANKIIKAGGNRGFSEKEKQMVKEFCDSIGFDPIEEFNRSESYKRYLLGRESADQMIGNLIDQ